jgi:hypothetical protein
MILNKIVLGFLFIEELEEFSKYYSEKGNLLVIKQLINI